MRRPLVKRWMRQICRSIVDSKRLANARVFFASFAPCPFTVGSVNLYTAPAISPAGLFVDRSFTKGAPMYRNISVVILSCLLILALTGATVAQQSQAAQRINFAPGAISATESGSLTM